MQNKTSNIPQFKSGYLSFDVTKQPRQAWKMLNRVQQLAELIIRHSPVSLWGIPTFTSLAPWRVGCPVGQVRGPIQERQNNKPLIRPSATFPRKGGRTQGGDPRLRPSRMTLCFYVISHLIMRHSPVLLWGISTL